MAPKKVRVEVLWVDGRNKAELACHFRGDEGPADKEWWYYPEMTAHVRRILHADVGTGLINSIYMLDGQAECFIDAEIITLSFSDEEDILVFVEMGIDTSFSYVDLKDTLAGATIPMGYKVIAVNQVPEHADEKESRASDI